jgi:Protein of unknown function (DUF4435)
VRQFITSATLAATIRMLRSTFSGSFLLVEGESDVRLFSRFIDRAKCQTFCCYGRKRLLGTADILDRDGFHGHLGIVDRDSSEIVGECITRDNVVFTDENDIEMTIFQSDSFDRFVAEYCNVERLSAFEQAKGESIRDTLIRVASVTGALRCLSKLKDWRLLFEDMTFRFEERRDLEISLDRQIEHLRGRSAGTTMPVLAEVEEELAKFRAQFLDPRSYVCGHDLCELVCKAVHDIFGRAHLALARSAVAIEEVFRVAFSIENFRATKLYADIRGWEKLNPPFIVLNV